MLWTVCFGLYGSHMLWTVCFVHHTCFGLYALNCMLWTVWFIHALDCMLCTSHMLWTVCFELYALDCMVHTCFGLYALYITHALDCMLWTVCFGLYGSHMLWTVCFVHHTCFGLYGLHMLWTVCFGLYALDCMVLANPGHHTCLDLNMPKSGSKTHTLHLKNLCILTRKHTHKCTHMWIYTRTCIYLGSAQTVNAHPIWLFAWSITCWKPNIYLYIFNQRGSTEQMSWNMTFLMQTLFDEHN